MRRIFAKEASFLGGLLRVLWREAEKFEIKTR